MRTCCKIPMFLMCICLSCLIFLGQTNVATAQIEMDAKKKVSPEVKTRVLEMLDQVEKQTRLQHREKLMNKIQENDSGKVLDSESVGIQSVTYVNVGDDQSFTLANDGETYLTEDYYAEGAAEWGYGGWADAGALSEGYVTNVECDANAEVIRNIKIQGNESRSAKISFNGYCEALINVGIASSNAGAGGKLYLKVIDQTDNQTLYSYTIWQDVTSYYGVPEGIDTNFSKYTIENLQPGHYYSLVLGSSAASVTKMIGDRSWAALSNNQYGGIWEGDEWVPGSGINGIDFSTIDIEWL